LLDLLIYLIMFISMYGEVEDIPIAVYRSNFTGWLSGIK
jgi:hypothetical protein